MKTEELEYRMYGLTLYNLSPIQQGIQFGHAVQEYNNKIIPYIYKKGQEPEDFERWRSYDKTFIILNGGTTNYDKDADGIYKGTLNKHLHTLEEQGIKTAYFYEPDLGDQLTAVVFLVDERVWDKEKYPDFEYNFDTAVWTKKTSQEYQLGEWKKSIGGEKNVFLREFLKQFKLA